MFTDTTCFRDAPPRIRRILIAAAIIACHLMTRGLPANLVGQERLDSPQHWRQPMAISIDAQGEWLAVGNRLSHSISILRMQDRELVAEYRIGDGLSAMCRRAKTSTLLVTDSVAHCVRLLDWNQDQLQQTQQLDVSPYPEGIASSPDGQYFAVTSLWSRRLTLFEFTPDLDTKTATKPSTPTSTTSSTTAAVKWCIDLEFAPQEVIFIEDGTQLIAADAFGGSLAIVETSTGKIIRQRTIPAHKIRGLAVTNDGQRLVVSHQMLNSLAHTIRNDVHWGLLMSNDLRWLDLTVLKSPDADFYKDSHMHPIGQANAGMGDPAGAVMSADGTVAVALAGVKQVVVGKEADFSLHAIDVGTGPTAVAFSPDSKTLVVTNRFGDSISWIDVEQKEVTQTTSLGPTPSLDAVRLGERLFHDATLAHDGWMSCSSCHVRGHTNGQLNDNLSDDSFGAPKRVLTLLGNAGTEPLAWNGSKKTMRDQIKASINLTMQGPRELNDEEIEALSTYVRTLPPAPSLTAARGESDAQSIARGLEIFNRQDCSRCHQPPLYTSTDLYDVGFEDEEGNREFNPPSLRGVSQRGPYFHDNRALSLEEVLKKYKHQVTDELTDQDRTDLIHFLQSL
jgi:cytochrome c peroxidase/sugar lactone lactonase YvrE